jgi:hypothetical protein
MGHDHAEWFRQNRAEKELRLSTGSLKRVKNSLAINVVAFIFSLNIENDSSSHVYHIVEKKFSNLAVPGQSPLVYIRDGCRGKTRVGPRWMES